MVRRKIELPWVKRRVMHEVATSNEPQVRIAERYGVAQSTLSEFITRHAAEIQEIRANAEDEFAGIAIASKAARLATYEKLLEAALALDENGDFKTDEDGEVLVTDTRSAARILRNVAEELGHLPTRVQLAGEVGVTTTYRVEGIDPEELK